MCIRDRCVPISCQRDTVSEPFDCLNPVRVERPKPLRCRIPSPRRVLTGVKVGDSVLLPDYGGQKVDLGDKDKELFLYSDQEILGVVESN